MRKIKLYIAISLDGKIAKMDGDVSWLDKIPNPDKTDYGYKDFYKNIDTLLMGNKTYEIVQKFDIDNPYQGADVYVFTRNTNLKSDEVKYVSQNAVDFVSDLKKKEGKDIWLMGGGILNTAFFNLGLIDEFLIYIMPVVIGDGIPLFGEGLKQESLQLINSTAYKSGVVELIYKKA